MIVKLRGASDLVIQCQDVVYVRKMADGDGSRTLWVIYAYGRGVPMPQHPNARLTPRDRETLVFRVAGGERVSDVARQMGVSRQAASK